MGGIWSKWNAISILLCPQNQITVSKYQNRNFRPKLFWVVCSIITSIAGVSVYYISDCTRGSNFKCELSRMFLRYTEMAVVSNKYIEHIQK